MYNLFLDMYRYVFWHQTFYSTPCPFSPKKQVWLPRYTHVCVTGGKSLMFQDVFSLDFSQTLHKLHHSSLYALQFIHTYESVDISHVDAQLTVQKLEQFQKSRSHDQPAQLVTITLLTPGSGLPAHQCHFTFPLTNLKC